MYNKQQWNNGTRLDAFRLNHLEDGVYQCSKEIEELKNKSVSKNNYITADYFEDLKNRYEQLVEEFNKYKEQQKKEITALKTKITKLTKKQEENLNA